MAKPGEYADVLRALGRILDQHGAHDVEIVDEGDCFGVAWLADGEQERHRRTYRTFDLDRLRFEARQLRSGRNDGIPQPGLAESLRTIGGELDRMGTELLSLTQVGESFQLSTMVQGRHITRLYTHGELRTLALEQRARRRPTPSRTSGVLAWLPPLGRRQRPLARS